LCQHRVLRDDFKRPCFLGSKERWPDDIFDVRPKTSFKSFCALPPKYLETFRRRLRPAGKLSPSRFQI
jgi:hypothetical protein